MIEIAFKMLALQAAVCVVALFEGAETALVTLTGMNMAQVKSRHPLVASQLEFLEAHPDRILVSMVLGSTLGAVVCGVLAASIGQDLARLMGLSGEWLLVPVSVLVTADVLVFGQVLPKILGRLYAERAAVILVVPLIPFSRLVWPVVQVLVRLARLFLRMLGREQARDLPNFSPSELTGMLETGSNTEPTAQSRRILKNILEFGQIRVRDACKPIAQVVTVDLRKTPKEVISEVTRAPYSRIPVWRDSLDNIMGIIYSKDLLAAWRTDGLILIPDLLRPAYFVSPDMRISELLREFKKGRHHFGVVKDAQGKVMGIITIEDLLEEIFGKVYDETQISAMEG